MAVFWLGPWSCCFWVLIYSQLSAVPWRQGANAVHQWREAHGGLLHTSIIATGWMFGALFFSYAAEFLLIVTLRDAVWLRCKNHFIDPVASMPTRTGPGSVE